MTSHRSAKKFASSLVALVLVTAAQQAHAGDDDPKAAVAPPNAVAAAKAARAEGLKLRTVGVLLAVGGGVGMAPAVYLATGPDDGGIPGNRISGYLIGALALPMALTGIGFLISGQCKIDKSDKQLQTLAILPTVTPNSTGFSLTGTF